MSDSARLKKFIQLKIFDDTRRYDDADAIERELEKLEEGDFERLNQAGERKQSAYVQVLEDTIMIVYKSEEHLLSVEEWAAFDAFRKLSYDARYCLSRLLLLKPNHWYSVKGLTKWEREVGKEGLAKGLEELCRPLKDLVTPNSTPVIVKQEEEEEQPPQPEIIDLTFDEDEDVKPDISALDSNAVAGPSRLPVTPPVEEEEDTFERIINYNPKDADLSYYLEDDSSMTIDELLNRLNVDELKALMKQNKCKPETESKPKKADYIKALLKNGSTQSMLNFAPNTIASKGKKKGPDPFRQTQLPFGRPGAHQTTLKGMTAKKPQHERLRKQVLDVLGKCYRVNYDFFKLVRRLHIIAFRSTEFPDKLMVPALLTRFKKRKYPSYKCKRDRDIWTSRQSFLEYEKALALEAHVDRLLEAEAIAYAKANDPKARATPAARASVAAATPKKAALQTPKPNGKSKSAKQEDPDAEYEDDESAEPPPESINVKKAKKLVEFLDNWLLKTWKCQLEKKHDRDRPPSLQRFEPGYIYTRLLRRTLQSLAALKQYDREMEIIQLLLNQHAWQRGKRAKLYDRRALIQQRYLWKFDDFSYRKEEVLKEALEGIKQALLDDDTHLIARPGLMRRLRWLEDKLDLPSKERAVCAGDLRKADVEVVQAKRIHRRASSLLLDTSGNVLNRTTIPTVESYFKRPTDPVVEGIQLVEDENPAETEQKKPSWRRKGKSVWEGRFDKQGLPTEVTVEERALQYYQDKGFRGFHAETSIMTTIWVLMNWDIIFADVRGAFETPYQSAPLDIVDDSFYHSRKALFDRRLDEIRDGKAAQIITRHDSMYRAQDVWAIGVSWDICQLPDLIEIVECLGGPSLATISRLFCEDYVGRSSGGPDLIVWNYEKRICKFVEVKGPGDTPQENQKLWFDSLLGAGIQVEICKVEDINDVKAQASAKKGKGKGGKIAASSVSRKRKQAAGKGKGHASEDEDEVDYDAMDRRSEDEDDALPRLSSNKRSAKRRKTNPGPLAIPSMPEDTPSKSKAS